MTKVRCGGRELSIEDELVDRYLAQGYSVIDSAGNVVRKGCITTMDTALKEIAKLRDEVERLTADRQALSAELDTLKGTLESDSSDSDEVEDGDKPDFRCSICGKVYKSQSALDKHIKDKHPEK